MKKTGKLMAAAAGVAAVMALSSASAFADSRHQNQTRDERSWREDSRDRDRGGSRDDRYRDNDRGRSSRDYLRGIVERVDIFRGTAVIRDTNSGRRVAVVVSPSARGRGTRRDRGLDLEDIRRGDYVTFRGDWERGGVFEAYHIDDVRSGRRR
jgi:hypothetical protein